MFQAIINVNIDLLFYLNLVSSLMFLIKKRENMRTNNKQFDRNTVLETDSFSFLLNFATSLHCWTKIIAQKKLYRIRYFR